MTKLNRRRFLRNLGVTAGGLAVAGAGGLTVFSSLANPRVSPKVSGQPLRAVPTLTVRRPEPGIVEAEIGAGPVRTDLAGFSVVALGYSGGSPGSLPSRLEGAVLSDVCGTAQGSVPGPTLRLREGELLRLKFANCLEGEGGGHHASAVTNLHLHGPLIPPVMDDPFTVLGPGESRSIELFLPPGSAGTHWYHPHPHGQVATQLARGLAGAVVVEGGLDDELRDWEEHLLVIQNFHVANQRDLDPQRERGNLIAINGQHRPVLQPRDSNLRLRLLNASPAGHYRLRLENHPLHLIATDGHFLESPVALEELVLAPGNRADVLVQLTGHSPVRLLALDYDIPEWVPFSVQPLMTIRPPARQQWLPLPGFLAPVERLDPARAVATRRLRFSGFDRINGARFDHRRVDFRARLGMLEIWELENNHHPFHLHSYPFQVLDRDGKPEPFRAWRDVVELNDGGRVRIAVPFRHYPGRTVFHCHIAPHEDAGMMGVLEVEEG